MGAENSKPIEKDGSCDRCWRTDGYIYYYNGRKLCNSCKFKEDDDSKCDGCETFVSYLNKLHGLKYCSSCYKKELAKPE